MATEAEGEESTDEWFVKAILSSQCEERLKYIAEIIWDDKQNGAEYTKDSAYMQRLRDAWIARSNSLKVDTK